MTALPKKPRRSLFTAVVEVPDENEITQVVEIVKEPPDAKTDGEKEEGEFEVEKIIDYDKVKVTDFSLNLIKKIYFLID